MAWSVSAAAQAETRLSLERLGGVAHAVEKESFQTDFGLYEQKLESTNVQLMGVQSQLGDGSHQLPHLMAPRLGVDWVGRGGFSWGGALGYGFATGSGQLLHDQQVQSDWSFSKVHQLELSLRVGQSWDLCEGLRFWPKLGPLLMASFRSDDGGSSSQDLALGVGVSLPLELRLHGGLWLELALFGEASVWGSASQVISISGVPRTTWSGDYQLLVYGLSSSVVIDM